MTEKQKKTRMAEIVAVLKKLYPEAPCALESGGDPYKLLVMGRLSAQCTDARVNVVCRELFAKYPTAESLAAADVAAVEEIVKPCGLFRTKARNIVDACRMLITEYGGTVPQEMDELLKFPGVGRKIANLLRGDIYGLPAIVADTHCIRICRRFGMYTEKQANPTMAERILVKLVAEEEQTDLCHRLVQFGRDVCTARSPKCDACPLAQLCEAGQGRVSLY
ncbi:MAG: endonuclease III [Ruminococcaceae bacterium]|nr:endonuclease III [Oscillospiraceae bacterium]